jgi:hypothetical protein
MDSEILIGDEYHFKEDWLIVYPATATYSVLIDGEPWATRSLKTFADDGSWVVFEEAGQLFAIPTEGGDAIPVTQSGTGSYIPTQTVPGADAIVYLVSNDYSPEPGRFYVASVPLVAAPIDVSIDIEPSREDNRIRADGRVSVLLRGSEELSVGSVATDTLRFGPGRAIPRYLTIGDLDRDGFDDVLAQFKVSDTGLVPGDTSACLSGQLDSGQEFVGCDAVHVVPSGRRR